jgi:coproporphyrinogen III oxidase
MTTKSIRDCPDKIKDEIIYYLKILQKRFVHAFEIFEPQATFIKTSWSYAKGSGGGEIGLLRGEVFEKAAVNWSGIQGDRFPMADAEGAFFATGISLITHMLNPHVPTAHFNIRFIQTQENFWFGGGYDLTPMGFIYPEDTLHFHTTTQKALDAIDKEIYPLFSKQAKEYFFIPHRNKERGIGGIFFDHYRSEDLEKDLLIWKTVGNTFLEAILPIYEKRIQMDYQPQDKQKQLEMRAHYVEFNLLYDRGTKFGFLSGGNPEAILCSMPPLVKW